MKKKLIIIAGALVLIGVAVLVMHTMYINSFVPSENIKNKVVFEGIEANIVVGESYSNVVTKIKEVEKSNNAKLIITVQSGYGGLDASSIDFDSLTSEEIDALLKEHRQLIKEYQSQNKGDISKELLLEFMNIEYSYDSYSPIIEAEFKGPLTKKDIADIYRIAKNERVLNVTVQVAE